MQAKGPSWENWAEALPDFVDCCIIDCENPPEVAAAMCKQLAPYALQGAKYHLYFETKTILETAALILELDTSHDKFNHLCKHTPSLFQPLHKVRKLWKSKDLKPEEIRDDDYNLIGFCVKALKNGVVIPKLR